MVCQRDNVVFNGHHCVSFQENNGEEGEEKKRQGASWGTGGLQTPSMATLERIIMGEGTDGIKLHDARFQTGVRY